MRRNKVNTHELTQVALFDKRGGEYLGTWYRLFDLVSDKWGRLGAKVNGKRQTEDCVVCGRKVGVLDFYDNLCAACAAAADDGEAANDA